MAKRLRAVAAHTIVLADGQGLHLRENQILPPHVQPWAEKTGDPDLYEVVPGDDGCTVREHAKTVERAEAAEAQVEALTAEVAQLKADLEAATAPDEAAKADASEPETPKRRGTIH